MSLAAPVQLNGGYCKLMLEVGERKKGLEDKVRTQSIAEVSPLLLPAPSRTLDSSNC